MLDLSLKLKSGHPDPLINTHILKAKYALYEINFSKIIAFLNTVDPRIVQIFETIHDVHALIFKDMSSKIKIYENK